MDSWQQLPTYYLEATPPFSSANSVGAAPYTASKLPSVQVAPVARISDITIPLDDRILPRLLRALERGLELLPPGLEFPNVKKDLAYLNRVASQLITNESQVSYHLGSLRSISENLAQSIYQSFDKGNLQVDIRPPRHSASQVGNAALIINDGVEQTTVSIEMKQPNPLFRHGGTVQGGLQTSSPLRRGKAAGAEAMSIEVSEPVS